MTDRNFPDWITAYVDYASYSEAPRRMHFWTAVSTVAGALRRRVWIDMAYFKWTPNFYIVFVAPPGIVSKSTTAAIGVNILKKVPGIRFGPDVVTWPALVSAFAEATESFDINGEWYSQSALTLESSEFGNLVNPEDREMIDLLVTLWDSRQGMFSKRTKGSGNDEVENPWINLIACTTPAWIAGNFPEYVIGGGFTSRVIFVYTDKKDKLVAYPSLDVPRGIRDTELLLVQDLERISQLAGPYELTPEAIAWGRAWYAHHYSAIPEHLADDRFGGYIARKQTHLHKTAMVLAASQRNELIITAEDLALANTMVTGLEADLPKVFSKIGRSKESVDAERFLSFVERNQRIKYEDVFRYVSTTFPNANDFEGIMQMGIRSGRIRCDHTGDGIWVQWIGGSMAGKFTNSPATEFTPPPPAAPADP